MNTVNVKFPDTELKILKNVVKDKTGTTLRIGLEMFNGNDLPHELLLPTKTKNKTKKCF